MIYENGGREPTAGADAFSGCGGMNADLRTFTRLETDHAVGQGKQGVIAAHADIQTRMPLGATLANDDVAGDHILAAEFLDAEIFGIRVPTVACTSKAFFVSHVYFSVD